MTGRGLRGRETAQLMLVVGFAPLAVATFLFVAAPNSMGGGPNPLGMLTTWLGVVGIVVGLALMIRIYRADPEGHRSWWRFHRS
jgi:hypothetical protein